MGKILPFLLLLGMFLWVACEGQPSQESSSSTEPLSETSPKTEASTASIDKGTMMLGQKVYETYCVTCHMADGNGVPDMNPPLTDPEWIEGDPERLIDLTLNGLMGPIEVNGDTYDNIMTPHNFLSDEDIAHVLTYIRNSFSHAASEVTADQVATIRAKGE